MHQNDSLLPYQNTKASKQHLPSGKQCFKALIRRTIREKRQNLSVKNCASILALTSTITFATHAQELIAPPDYNAVDRFNVNLASGEVQFSQTPVFIGGENGLSLTASTYSSDFYNIFSSEFISGFNDSNRGAIFGLALSKNSYPDTNKYQYGVKVFGFGYSDSFAYTNNTFTNYKENSSSTLHYDNSSSSYVYTTSDGSQLYYKLSTQFSLSTLRSGQGAILSKIIYPNGRTIEIYSAQGASSSYPRNGSIYSVRTNTGYQLKYNTAITTGSTPKSVTAINNTFATCKDSNTTCSVSGWPTASFSWPGNGNSTLSASNTMQSETDFVITDAAGRSTTYTHTPYEYEGNDNFGGYFDLPRITQVSQDGKVQFEYEYDFNTFAGWETNGTAGYFVSGFPTLDRASSPGRGERTYAVQLSSSRKQIISQSTGQLGPNEVGYFETTTYGAFVRAVTWNATVQGDYQPRYNSDGEIKSYFNEVASVTDLNGSVTTYVYDDRGNITSREQLGTTVTAQFPSTCSNLKTCNKPEWVEDANGNRTNYTYHAQSGNLETVTLPANEQGVRAQTRYFYDQYRAKYLNENGTLITGTPIWLLKEERYCINSAFSNDKCVGNDEVIITYEYDVNQNLNLKGMTTQGDGELRRVCYEYDRLGNRIGEISPNSEQVTCD